MSKRQYLLWSICVCLSTHANTQIVGHVLLTALCGLMYGNLLSCTYCQFLVAPYYIKYSDKYKHVPMP